MPDALTHYASSHLASRATLKPKQAALAGLLPDPDALRAQAGHPQPGAGAGGRAPRGALRAAHNAGRAHLAHTGAPTPRTLHPDQDRGERQDKPQGPALAATAAGATCPTNLTRKPYVEGPLVEAGLALLNTPKAYWPEVT